MNRPDISRRRLIPTHFAFARRETPEDQLRSHRPVAKHNLRTTSGEKIWFHRPASLFTKTAHSIGIQPSVQGTALELDIGDGGWTQERGTVLAGCTELPFAAWWRLRLFFLLVRLNKWLSVVRRIRAS